MCFGICKRIVMCMQSHEIVVSISCITYNHAQYIRQCLDGFLMQKTNFAFEVLIHDDASTDGTTDIIKEYEAKYPDIIKPIYEEENQWIKGRRGSSVFNFPRAKGKYIALCEGDDCWTDSLKLQKQVDFLDKNQEYALSCHGYIELDESNGEYYDWTPKDFDIITLDKFINGHCCVTTLSVMFRYQMLLQSNYFKYKHQMDIPLFYSLLSLGQGYYMPNKMAIYRKHYGGVWSSGSSEEKWTISFKAKMEILEVENNGMASKYMYEFLLIPESRLTMLRHARDISFAIVVICKYCGLKYAINIISFILLKKTLFNLK